MTNCSSMRKNKNIKLVKDSRKHFATTTKPHKSHQHGGSPASSLVMQDTTQPRPFNDYVVSSRIRDPGYDDSLASVEPKCMSGGSPASDLVMENLTDNSTVTVRNGEWDAVKGDMNSLNLYQTTGGRRRMSRRRSHSRSRSNSKKSRSKNHSKRNKQAKTRKNDNRERSRNRNRNRNSNRSRNMRGGASDWIMSQYSQGPINSPDRGTAWSGQFSASAYTPFDQLRNPATMGLAGSGYPMGALEGLNVRHNGAPLV